jgi:hypothetical protein
MRINEDAQRSRRRFSSLGPLRRLRTGGWFAQPAYTGANMIGKNGADKATYNIHLFISVDIEAVVRERPQPGTRCWSVGGLTRVHREKRAPVRRLSTKAQENASRPTE